MAGLLPAPIPRTLSATAVTDAGGRASVTLGQVSPGVRWRTTSITVQSTSVGLSEALIYKGPTDTASYLLDGTGPLGGNQNTTGTIVDLGAGEVIRVVWRGADPGSSCSAVAQIQVYNEGAR